MCRRVVFGLLAPILAPILAVCSVGPDFVPPKPPDIPAWRDVHPPHRDAGHATQ